MSRWFGDWAGGEAGGRILAPRSSKRWCQRFIPERWSVPTDGTGLYDQATVILTVREVACLDNNERGRAQSHGYYEIELWTQHEKQTPPPPGW